MSTTITTTARPCVVQDCTRVATTRGYCPVHFTAIADDQKATFERHTSIHDSLIERRAQGEDEHTTYMERVMNVRSPLATTSTLISSPPTSNNTSPRQSIDTSPTPTIVAPAAAPSPTTDLPPSTSTSPPTHPTPTLSPPRYPQRTTRTSSCTSPPSISTRGLSIDVRGISQEQYERERELEFENERTQDLARRAASRQKRTSIASSAASMVQSPIESGSTTPRLTRGHSFPLSSRWDNPMHPIHFLSSLSSFHSNPQQPSTPTDDTSQHTYDSEMSDADFARLTDSMTRREMLASMNYMYTSLKQYRTLLTETNNLSASHLDKDDTCYKIVSRIKSIVGAEIVLLLLLDKSNSSYTCSASTRPIDYTVAANVGFASFVAKHKQTLSIKSSAETDERHDSELSRRLGTIMQSLMCVPVFNKSRQITAVIYVINKKSVSLVGSASSVTGTATPSAPTHFNEQDQTLVEFLALLAGHTIENALLYDEAVSRRIQTETLLQITELMAAEIDTDKIIQRVIEASYLLVNAERITLWMLDHHTDELVSHKTKDRKESTRVPVSKGIVGYVATTGKAVNSADVEKDWRYDIEADHRDGIKIRSSLNVPVNDHLGKTVAVIEAVNKRVASHQTESAAFTRDEEALLQSMAVSAGIILRKAQLYEEAINRRKQTEALLQITELMSAELGVSKVVQKIVQATYMLVSAERITLYMVDERRHELVSEVARDGSQGRRIPLGTGIPGHVALTGRLLNIPDAKKDWRFDSSFDEKMKYDTQTILALPVKDFLGKTVAVIEVVNKKTVGDVIVEFSLDDEIVLKSLAVTAGTVLRKARLFDEAIIRRRQTEALLQITELMSAEIGTEKVMQRIIEASYTLVNAERITLFEVHPRTQEIICKVSKDPAFQGVRMAYGHGIVGHVALTSRSLNIPDAYADPRFDPATDIKTGYKTRSILTVPVTDRKGSAVAVVQAVNKRGGDEFTQEDVSILESMAVSAGIILYKARLLESAISAERKNRALLDLVMVSSREDVTTESIINDIAKVAYDALNADRITIYFVDNIKEELSCIVCQDVDGWSLPLGKGIAGYVGQTGETVNCDNAYQHIKFDPAFDQKSGYVTHSVLCMPVKNTKGETIAVIQALNKKSSRHRDYLSSPRRPFALSWKTLAEDGHGSRTPRAMDDMISSTPKSHDEKEQPLYEAFTLEDEEILAAFCLEVRNLLIRHIREAMIEMNQLKMNDSVYSLMELYTGRVPNRLSAVSTKKYQPFADAFVWPELKSSKLAQLNDLDFNVWLYSPDDLLVFTYEIFNEMKIVDTFQIPVESLKNFFLTVRQNYRDNPFHNWYHGFSVLHFAYLALRSLSDASQYLTHQDVLGLLVASLCHDIDHPAHTNSYEINTGSELALLHNDLSVLENHHAYTTFRILRQKSTNIFCNIRRENAQALKKTIVSAILNTDMTCHFESCKALDARESDLPFNVKLEADRQLVVNVLIHSADLSGQVFGTSVAKVWEERISREFEAQAQKESAMGIPVASFMQNLSDPVLRNKNQVNFIDFVLVPWWRSMTRVFPGFKPCYKNLLENRRYYNTFAHTQSSRDSSRDNSGSDTKSNSSGSGGDVTTTSASTSAPSTTTSISTSTSAPSTTSTSAPEI